MGESSYAVGIGFDVRPKPLIGEVQEGNPAGVRSDCGYFVPLGRRKVGTGRIVTASVQDYDVTCGNRFDRFDESRIVEA